jgi:hypothetical protein
MDMFRGPTLCDVKRNKRRKTLSIIVEFEGCALLTTLSRANNLFLIFYFTPLLSRLNDLWSFPHTYQVLLSQGCESRNFGKHEWLTTHKSHAQNHVHE